MDFAVSVLKGSKTTSWLSAAAILIVVLGAAFRFAYNRETLFIEPVRADAAKYFHYAVNLVEHGTFSMERSDNPTPDSFWHPGYPSFLALIFLASDHTSPKSYTLVLCVQVILAAASIWILFLLGKMFMPSFWPLLPALLLALSPHHVSLGSYALTETLFCFTLLTTIYFLARGLNSQSKLDFFISGISLAASYMVNPVCLVVAPAALLAIWINYLAPRESRGNKPSFGAICLLILPLIVASSLWSMRSHYAVPESQLDSGDRLLKNLTIGLYPEYHEEWKASLLDPEAGIVPPGAGIDESYGTFMQEAMARFSENPIGMIKWYAVGKPIQLWQWHILTGMGDIYIYEVMYSLYHTSPAALLTYSIMYALHPWLLLCSLAGAALVLFRKNTALDQTVPLLCYAAIASISGVYVITQAEPRYSVPLRPELYLTAIYFIYEVFRYTGELRTKSVSADCDDQNNSPYNS